MWAEKTVEQLCVLPEMTCWELSGMYHLQRGRLLGALLLRTEREVETEGQSCKEPPLSRCAQSFISQVRRQRLREEQELAQGHTAG